MASPTLEIARREFLEHVLSWRFAIALVLSSLIAVTSVVALGAAYKEDADSFRLRQDELERPKDGNSFGMPGGEPQINKVLGRPNLLGIFFGGPADDLRAKRADNFGEDLGGGSGRTSPTNLRFEPLDTGFVVVAVLTFMAVLFSYDAVSGERERGTLKLVLSNPVPKDAILLGKYLGGMGSVLLAFGIALLLGISTLGIIGLRPSAEEWTRLGAVLGIAALLVSAFYLIGLLVSSVARRSATSLLTLTLVWLVLAFGVGNAAAVVAKSTSSALTPAALMEDYRAIDEKTFNRFDELNAEIMPLRQRMFEANGTLPIEDMERLQALEKEQTELFAGSAKDREALRAAARRQLDNELARAETLASLSPAEAFRTLSTALAKTDYWSYRDAVSAVEAYRKESAEAYREWSEANPQPPGPIISFRSVGSGMVRSWGGPGDGFQWPEFRYEEASVAETLGSPARVRDLLVLVATNVLAFLGAYAAFLRYDVR